MKKSMHEIDKCVVAWYRSCTWTNRDAVQPKTSPVIGLREFSATDWLAPVGTSSPTLSKLCQRVHVLTN